MKKILFSMLFLALLFGSCQQEDVNLDPTDLTKEQTEEVEGLDNEPHVCTEMCLDENESAIDESIDPQTRGVLWKSSKWPQKSVIKVKFMNGTALHQSKVRKYAAEWSKYCNIRFQFVASNQNADIRVAFKWKNDGGSWSYVGTDCRYIKQSEPTMNFGWFTTGTAENEYSRTITHEFGHALGLMHEHQHPTNTIKWNKPVVYAYYAKQGWNKAKVDQNIFAKYNKLQTNYSGYDRYSIMHYSIDKAHTTNGYSVGWNRYLSITDKAFIRQQYPR